MVKLNSIEILNRSNCKIKDTIKVERFINELISGGVKKLQIVSDFDFTITKQRHHEDGAKVLTSFGIFNECQSLPITFRKESDNLFVKYRPIEIDPKISIEKKTQFMIEWWTQTGDLLK